MAKNIPSLLLIDMLGVRARWAEGGAEGATEAFDTLIDLVDDAVDENEDITCAVVESDMSVILCRSASAALRTGREIFQSAFGGPASRERRRRVWLRGVCVPRPKRLDLEGLRRPQRRSFVHVYEYAPAVLEAIALEKCGFRGMRLVVSPELLTDGVRSRMSIGTADEPVVPFRRLAPAPAYPRQLDGFEDLLWMADEDPDKWRRYRARMTTRLRQASYDNEELVQAAATQIVFDECERALAPLLPEPARVPVRRRKK